MRIRNTSLFRKIDSDKCTGQPDRGECERVKRVIRCTMENSPVKKTGEISEFLESLTR